MTKFARLAVPNAIDSMRGYEQTDDYLAWRNRSEGKYLHRHGPVAPAAVGRGASARAAAHAKSDLVDVGMGCRSPALEHVEQARGTRSLCNRDSTLSAR